jgi:hypothetical protein
MPWLSAHSILNWIGSVFDLNNLLGSTALTGRVILISRLSRR